MNTAAASRPALHRGPTWKTHLVLFGLLIGAVLAYFFWQVGRARQTFELHVTQSARIIAGVIERNARSAVLSQAVVEEIMETFLGNMARFVDYLDTVAPFSPDELAAFAAEAGLAGILIQRGAGAPTEGPPGWIDLPRPACAPQGAGLNHLTAAHLYYLDHQRRGGPGCIVVGISSSRLETLQRQISLPTLLRALEVLPGIRYVRLDPLTDQPHPASGQAATVHFHGVASRRVAESTLVLSDNRLVVGIEAAMLARTEAQLWREFAIFSLMLAVLGTGLSVLLQRMQAAHLTEVRRFERRLAQEREDAALGRATAAIAHEVKNPLNAIGMGLQRLKIEAGQLAADQRELVDGMLTAVKRADGIIGGLRRYARPLEPQPQPIRPTDWFDRVLPLYESRIRAQGIDLTVTDRFDGTFDADPALLEEVLENLLRNAMEAQPDGGKIHIDIRREGDWAVLVMENDGCAHTAAEAGRILAPYFTTKTQGSGLGLPIAARIVLAHGGRLDVAVPRPGRLQVIVHLPAGRGPDNAAAVKREP